MSWICYQENGHLTRCALQSKLTLLKKIFTLFLFLLGAPLEAESRSKKTPVTGLAALEEAPRFYEDSRGQVAVISVSRLFDKHRINISPQGMRILSDVAKRISRLSFTEISVEGYTDSRGAKLFNQRTSQKQAEAALRAMIIGGIPRERLRALGKGEENPVSPNNTAEGREQNRRIEIVIYQKKDEKTH